MQGKVFILDYAHIPFFFNYFFYVKKLEATVERWFLLIFLSNFLSLLFTYI
jgi:hypothetical protein